MTSSYKLNQLWDRFNQVKNQIKEEQSKEEPDLEELLDLYREAAGILSEVTTVSDSVTAEKMKRKFQKQIQQMEGSEPSKSETSKPSEDTDEVEPDDQWSKWEVETPETTFKDVGGMENVIRELNRKVIKPIRNAETYEEYGLTVVNGVLFYGPPGTGKTHMAKALAGELNIHFVEATGSELKGRYMGESESNVAELFELASQHQPCMIFMDEIDAVASNRGESGGSGKSDMVSKLLSEVSELEDKQVFIVGATNFPNRLDPAIVRPGRLDVQIKIGLPSKRTRFAILRKQLQNRIDKVDSTSIDLRTIAEDSYGYTAADLKHLVDEAARIALEDNKSIQQRELRSALEKTSPSYRSDSD